MRKSNKSVVVVACACNVCGQASKAQANTQHFGCTGVSQAFLNENPALKGRFSRPDNKGTWEPVPQA